MNTMAFYTVNCSPKRAFSVLHSYCSFQINYLIDSIYKYINLYIYIFIYITIGLVLVYSIYFIEKQRAIMRNVYQ